MFFTSSAEEALRPPPEDSILMERTMVANLSCSAVDSKCRSVGHRFTTSMLLDWPASFGTGTGNVPAHTHVVLQLTITVVKDPHSSPVTGRLNLVDLASRDTALSD
eukprot:Colp12_sorted_trinity150504_noHs@21607